MASAARSLSRSDARHERALVKARASEAARLIWGGWSKPDALIAVGAVVEPAVMAPRIPRDGERVLDIDTAPVTFRTQLPDDARYGDSPAVLRAQLDGTVEHGPAVERAVRIRLGDGSRRTLVVRGRLSAVDRAFPDELTRETWSAAGVDTSWCLTALQIEGERPARPVATAGA